MKPAGSGTGARPAPARLAFGTTFALMAASMWALELVAPLMLPDYPPALLTLGRNAAYGLVALLVAVPIRSRLARLSGADWRTAIRLSLVGNFAYYLCVAASVQHAGALAAVVIGCAPVGVAIIANRRDADRDGHVAWPRLLLPLLLIIAGVATVQWGDGGTPMAGTDPGRRELGVLVAAGALACWVWYPLRNAEWLRAHPDRSPAAWATAQGLAALPLSALGALAWFGWDALSSGPQPPFGLGPRPLEFLALMLAVGLLASWLGALCWNVASQRLPTRLAGQLIGFETLAALAYACLWHASLPALPVLAGVALLTLGVVCALRAG